jgi:hypothetical protein
MDHTPELLQLRVGAPNTVLDGFHVGCLGIDERTEPPTARLRLTDFPPHSPDGSWLRATIGDALLIGDSVWLVKDIATDDATARDHPAIIAGRGYGTVTLERRQQIAG